MRKSRTDQIDEIKLPKLGESISEATIIDWLVKEGDFVEEGQIILEVATDKVDSEIPSPIDGEIETILVYPDEVVKIGEVIGRIKKSSKAKSDSHKKDSSLTSKPDKKGKRQKSIAEKRTKSQASEDGQEYVLPKRNDNRFYSPLVEQIAKKHHISYEELARIPATGKEGRLRKSDIYKYLENGRPAQFVQATPVYKPSEFRIPDLKFDKGKGKIIEMDRMGKMIADHMVFSKHTSPHVTAYVEADMTDMVTWRNAHKKAFQEEHDEKLTFTPLFIQAVTKAIKDFPRINSFLDDNKIIVKEEINIGMATALANGNLIVPVVKNTSKKDLKTLAKEVNTLAVKARDNKLEAEDTREGTFTISNVGTFGSVMGTPIINQPEAAILATGIIKKRAEVMEYKDGDKIEIRHMMYLCLSFDHRFIGGHLAGSFLRRVADYLEDFDTQKDL